MKIREALQIATEILSRIEPWMKLVYRIAVILLLMKIYVAIEYGDAADDDDDKTTQTSGTVGEADSARLSVESILSDVRAGDRQVAVTR